jgi:flagellar hook-associated protein 3
MKISTNTAVDNILDNYSRLLNIQNQMAKGRSVLNPSDDPLAVNEAVRIQTVLAQIEQYERNVNIGESFLSLSDSVLQSVNDIEKQARALTVGMASDSMTSDARQAATIEINSYLEELVEIGNRKFGERYIFGGTRTMSQVFSLVGSKYVVFNGNEADIDLQVDNDSYETVNTKATDVFGSLITKETSDRLAPSINMGIDTSTRLEDLNDGEGVPDGSIRIRVEVAAGTFTEYDVDLRSADTLEDVKEVIELNTAGNVTVDSNTSSTGINITNAVFAGNFISVAELANNTVARDLGILGSAAGGVINGGNLDPTVAQNTLLSDIPGYYGNPISIANGSDNLIDAQLNEVTDAGNYLSGYQLSGLSAGSNTSLDNKLFFEIVSSAPPVGYPRNINVYKDRAMNTTDLVATGSQATAAASTTITLNPANGSGLSGSVVLDNFSDGTSTEMDVVFPASFNGVIQEEIFQEAGDLLNQVDSWQIHGLRRGIDTGAAGELTYSVGPGGLGTQVDIINPISGQIVAQGSIAGTSGIVTLAGIVDGNGVDHTQLNGSVNLDYVGTAIANQNLTATFKTVEEFTNAVENSDTYTTATITDDGRGLEISSRLAGATLHLVETNPSFNEINGSDDLRIWNLSGIQAGVNSDVNGNVFVNYTNNGADYTVDIYSDSARTNRVATGTYTGPPVPAAPPGNITLALTELNNSGITGSVELHAFSGNDTDIELTDLSLGMSGKFRADNIFSTMNRVIDAGSQDDTEALHDLLGNFDDDIERVLNSRGTIGSRLQRFDLLKNRLADETTNFTNIMSKRIDLDYADAVVKFQQESNIFNASLSVAGKIIPMSLVDYI